MSRPFTGPDSAFQHPTALSRVCGMRRASWLPGLPWAVVCSLPGSPPFLVFK